MSNNELAIRVNPQQERNPALKFMKSVPWLLDSSLLPDDPDFVVSSTACVLYCPLKYHQQNPAYLFTRIASLQGRFQSRILILIMDLPDFTCRNLLKDLSHTLVVNHWTLVCSWNQKEVATYLESFRDTVDGSVSVIKLKSLQLSETPAEDFLSHIRLISRADAITLCSQYQSIKEISLLSVEELSGCPGIGPKKAKSIYSHFRQSFSSC